MARAWIPGACRVGWASLFVASAAAAAAADPPACTPRQVAEWKLVRENQLGMAGVNRDAHYIGAFAGRTKASWGAPGDFGGRNWFPADVYRKTVCGPLWKFSLYATPVTGAERDFHPYYKRPSPPFEYLLDDLETVASTARHIYGEITLPRALERSPWWMLPGGPSLFFNSRVVESSLTGEEFCVYGPWVWEEFHANQPEIHPSEQMWFRHPESEGQEKLYWVVAQDASDRFEDERDFCPVMGQWRDCDEPGSPKGRPWAPRSVRAEAQVGYELFRARSETTIITVRHVSRGRLPLADQERDTLEDLPRGPYGDHRLVVRRPPVAKDFSVSFGGECTTDGGQRLQGYVLVRTDVQTSGGMEGFHVVEIQAPFTARPARLVAPEADDEAPTVPLESIRRDDARRTLVGTYRMEGRAVEVPLLGGARPAGGTIGPHGGPATPLPSANPVPRFKDLDDLKRRGAWTRAEADVSVAYEAGTEGGEALADVLNNGLAGRVPGHPPTPEAWRQREGVYAGVYGQEPFRATLRATVTEGGAERELMLTSDCGEPPESENVTVAVCFTDRKGASVWQSKQEVADVDVWTRNDFAGDVRLSVDVTDPFGQVGEARRTYSFPWAGLEDGLLPGFVQTWAQEAGFTDPAKLRSLWELREDDAAPRREAETAPGSGLLCGERARRARLLHLYGLFACRDLEIDGREEAALRALAARLSTSAEDPPSCAVAAP